MIITERHISVGGKIPKGYGFAWHAPDSFEIVCLPIPFNKIIGAFRAWYLEWRRPVENDPIIAAYDRGRSDGYWHGRKVGEEQTHRLYGALLGESFQRNRQNES